MKRVLSILIWTLAAAFGCNASTWFVKVDGGTSTSGTMWTTSWNFDTFLTKLSDGTIAEGDMVCFAGGVYRSNVVNPINIITVR